MITREERLKGVHPDLVRIVLRAAERTDFQVLEGLRTLDQERQMIAQGHSSLKDPMRCRHVTGHAVDLGVLISIDYRWQISWKLPLYRKLAEEMKRAAAELGKPLECGIDWPHLVDGPHFQLPWAQYPITPGHG